MLSLLNNNIMDEHSLVNKVNELFHLQQDKDWQSKSVNFANLFGMLKYYDGQRTALQNLIGNIDADTDNILSNKINRIEERIENIEEQITDLKFYE